MLRKDDLCFMLNQRAVTPVKPEDYEGIRLYWAPKDIHKTRERLKSLGYRVSKLEHRDYGQTEFFLIDDDGYSHCFRRPCTKIDISLRKELVNPLSGQGWATRPRGHIYARLSAQRHGTEGDGEDCGKREGVTATDVQRRHCRISSSVVVKLRKRNPLELQQYVAKAQGNPNVGAVERHPGRSASRVEIADSLSIAGTDLGQ